MPRPGSPWRPGASRGTTPGRRAGCTRRASAPTCGATFRCCASPEGRMPARVRDNGGVSDPQNLPQPSDPEPSAGVGDDLERVDPLESTEGDGSAQRVERMVINESVETDVTDDVVTVRRAPRYGRFITLGALVGAVVPLILTFAFSGQPVDPALALGFDKGQVFGFLLLLCATIGAAIGAVVALLIDRSSARPANSVPAVHEPTHRVDDE